MELIKKGDNTVDRAVAECTKVPAVVDHTNFPSTLDSLEIMVPESSKVVVTGVDDSPEDKVLEAVVKLTVDWILGSAAVEM